eukprot:COSAG02_NODE_3039_length_7496_cov_89.964715_6_plen_184_part_00
MQRPRRVPSATIRTCSARPGRAQGSMVAPRPAARRPRPRAPARPRGLLSGGARRRGRTAADSAAPDRFKKFSRAITRTCTRNRDILVEVQVACFRLQVAACTAECGHLAFPTPGECGDGTLGDDGAADPAAGGPPPPDVRRCSDAATAGSDATHAPVSQRCRGNASWMAGRSELCGFVVCVRT